MAVKIPTFPTIARIIDVRDTRDRIEVGDRLVPVPGSGDLRPCDRCCREHEVHVDVELSDGRRANIGSGCAKGETMEVQGRLKSAVSAAKTRSRLAAELGVAKEQLTKAEAAWREVQALKLPPPVLIEEIPEPRGMRQVWGMGDYEGVWTLPGKPFDAERRQTLENGWRRKRYQERGFGLTSPHSDRQLVDDLENRLDKIERKLGALMF